MKAALRVNPHNPNTAFMPQGKDKNPARYVRGGAKLLPKLPGAALPNTMSWKDQGDYIPEPSAAPRSGSQDFLTIKSRGF